MKNLRFAPINAQNFRFFWPSAAEWWQSGRWVLLVITILIGLTQIGSFVSYESVVSNGHPWLPARPCPGCFLCGMTRSFCAMSSGEWQQASEWNRGGPILYTLFWFWLLLSCVYAVLNARTLLIGGEI